MKSRRNTISYHVMLMPGMLLLLVFSIIPMLGSVIAFEDFNPAKGVFGSRWVGLDNIMYMLQMPDSKTIFFNTLIIANLKIIFTFLASVIFALLLNEVRVMWLKKTVQTIVYVPYFLSWVILSGMFITIFDLDGMINQLLAFFHIQPIMFLGSNTWFRPILVGTHVWKEFGFGAIVYLAAMTGINPTLYEAASMDGATRLQKILYVTLPGISSTMILMLTLSLGNVLNAGFEQVLNMYNPLVYQTGDIIDTYVYRVGLLQMQYGLATAVGLLKSVVSFIMIVISYKLAEKYANYRIF